MAPNEPIDLDAPESFDEEEFAGDPEYPVGEERNVTEDGGVKKTVLVQGQGFDNPENGDKVRVHYVGTLEDGTKFDSSRDRDEPFEFELGASSVIQGWEKGVATMRKGEKSTFKLTADYGYGANGSPPKIPGGATLIFEVELLEWISMKDISLDGGVIKTTTVSVTGYEMPKNSDEVVVHYKAKVKGEDTWFLESPEEGVTFTISEGHLCKGIPVAIKTMKEGEKVSLDLRADYAFGTDGMEGCPADADVEMELELAELHTVTDVMNDGHVIKKLLKREGDQNNWRTPNEGASVRVTYTAFLAGTSQVVAECEEPSEYITDEEVMPLGFDKAIMRMREGETAEVRVSADWAYGQKGAKLSHGDVPPDAALVYSVKLHGFECAKESFELSPLEKVDGAEAKKEKGNRSFKRGSYKHAADVYERGLQLLAGDDPNASLERKQKISTLKKSLLTNKAACHLKLKEYKQAVAACTKVLDQDPSAVKALFRRASAYMAMQDYVEAQMDLTSASGYEPDNREVKRLMQQLKATMKKADKRDKKVFGAMFKKELYSAEELAAEKAAAAARQGEEMSSSGDEDDGELEVVTGKPPPDAIPNVGEDVDMGVPDASTDVEMKSAEE